MRESYYLKEHFSLFSLGKGRTSNNSNITQTIKVQLSFSSSNDIKVVRGLISEINGKFGKNIFLFSFLSRLVTRSVFNTSSFNFVILTKSKLALFVFFDLLFRLNINFSIISFNSSLDLFSANFFKSFIKNKLVLDSKSNLLNGFSENLLLFFKRMEFFRIIRFLKLLKIIKKQ